MISACGGGGGGNGTPPTPTPTQTPTQPTNPNQPPVASAGDDGAVSAGAEVTLNGSATDPDNESLSYAWTQTGGDADVSLSDSTAQAPTFTAPTVDRNVTLTFRLTVTDPDGATDIDEVTITINAPTIANPDEDEAPTLQSVAFAEGGNSARDGDDTLESGDEIRLAVTFSKPVLVRGTPLLRLVIGGKARYARYESSVVEQAGLSRPPALAFTPGPAVGYGPLAQEEDQGSGSTTLIFVYTVQADDDPEGDIEIPANPLVVNESEGEAIVSADNPEVAAAEETPADSFEVSKGLAVTDAVDPADEEPAAISAPPAAVAGANQAVNAGDVVTLDGSGSADPDGGTLVYSWTPPEGTPTVSLSDSTAARPTFTIDDITTDATLTFELTVTDVGGLIDIDQVTITVNAPPTASAGTDQVVNGGTTATLDGSGSDDPGGGTLTYSWTQTGGTPMVTLSNPAIARPTFAADAVTTDATLTFQLEVTDAGGLDNRDQVTITLNASPTASAGTAQAVTAGTPVTLDGSGSGDPGGGTIVYSWREVSETPTVSLSDPAAERPTFATNTVTTDTTLIFHLTVTDENDLTAAAEVAVIVNASPPQAEAGADISARERGSVTLDGSDSRDPGGAIATYSWMQTGGAPMVSLPDPVAGRTTFDIPDLTANTTLTFELTVTDAGGLFDTDAVQVMVQAVNDPPTADAGVDRAVGSGSTVTLVGSGTDPEGQALTYAWSQPGSQDITLSDTVAAEPTFTVPTATTTGTIRAATYTFTLTVSDGAENSQDSVVVHVIGDELLTMERHEGAVRGVSISRDGSHAVSGGQDGAVRLWNANTGTVIRTLGHHDGAVYAVAINADGTHAISGGADGTVRLWTWDQTSGSEVTYDDGAGGMRSLGDKGIWVYAVALNKDGTRAASGGFDGAVRVWNTDAADTTDDANKIYGEEITYAVSGSATGETRSLGSHFTVDNNGTFFTTSDDTRIPTSVYGVSLSDNGNHVLSGGADGAVRLWNVGTGAQLRSLVDGDGPMGAVFGVSLSGDGTVAAAGSADNHVHVWNADTGIETHELTGHTADVSSVSLNAAGTRLLSAGGDGTVRLWNANTGVAIRTLRRHTDYVWSASLALSDVGDVALSGGGDGTMHLWNTGTQPADTTEPFATTEQDRNPAITGDVRSTVLAGHTATVIGVSLSADGRLAQSGGTHPDNTVRLWDTATGRHLRTMTGHATGVFVASLSADGRLALSGAADNTVRLWDTVTGDNLHTMTGHARNVFGVSLSKDGRLALSGSVDGTVRLWDATTGTHLHTMTGHTDQVWDVSLSADGRLALSGSLDDTVRLWGTTTGAHLGTMTGHTNGVVGVSLSADGHRALSGSIDRTVRLWDATTGEHLRTMAGHTEVVYGVSLSADGRLALSGSWDHTVRLWDAATGEHLRTMTGHVGQVWDVSLSADGRLAMSGGSDETARLWRLGRSDDVAVPETADADAGEDQAAKSASQVVLDGSGSTDAGAEGGRPVAYHWRQTAGTEVTLSADDTETATFTAPVVTSNSALTFELVVTDANGLVDTEQVTITVGGQLAADAGADQTVAPDAMVTLDGSGSVDPAGGVLTYAWSQPSAQGIALTGANTAAPTFTAPMLDTTSIRAGTPLVFTLTITDTNTMTAQDTVAVHVGEGLFTMEDHEAAVRGVSISRDGTRAVSGGLDGTVRLWNADTGAVIRTLGSHDGAVYAVAINADGTHAISGGADGTVRLWTWTETSGSEVMYDDGAGGMRSLGDGGIWVYAVALNRDGTRAASGGFDGAVRVWNTDATDTTDDANKMYGEEITYAVSGGVAGEMRSLGTHGQHSVYGVSLNDAGDRVLSGGANGTVRLWNVADGNAVRTLSDGSRRMGAVFAVNLNGAGSVAAAGSADNHVRVWNASTGTETHELSGHTADVSGVSLNEAGTRVLSSGGDGTVRLWNVDASDMANGAEIRTLRQHTDYAWSASLSGDGIVALSGGGDGSLHLWNTAAQPPDTADPFATTERDRDPAATGDVRSRELMGHTGAIRGVSLSADGRFALSGSYDRTARLWDATTATHLRTMAGHFFDVRGASLSADGRLALTTGSDSSVYLWNATTATRLRTMAGHTATVTGASLSADGRLALSGSHDYRARVWSASTGTETQELSGHTNNVYGVSLSADGRLALSGSSDGTVGLWNAATGMRLHTMSGHTGIVWDVSLSADGHLALSGGGDNTVRLWDATTGTHLRTMTDHTSAVIGVSLSADGRLALSGSLDGTVRLWDATTGAYLRTMTGHASSVWAVSLSADGRVALSGSSDGTAHLWNLGRSDDTVVSTTAEAEAGGIQTVAAASMVTLDGSGSTDSRTMSGEPIAYYWRQTAGASATLSANNAKTATFTAPAVTQDTDLTFELTVTDELGLTHTDAVTITVNALLTVGAGDDQDVTAGATATLNGSATALNGGTITYSWTQTGGMSVTLSDPALANPTFTAPTPTNIRDGVLTFTLTATDTNSNTAADQVTVRVGGAGLITMEDHAGTVRGVSISRDGSLAVSGGLDGTVRLWNANTGAAIRTLGSHDGAVYAVAINADGTRAISGGADGTVRLWTWTETSGSEVMYDDGAGGMRSLGNRGVWIYAVALNKDGSRAASSGFDGTLRVWNTDATDTADDDDGVYGEEITYVAPGGGTRNLGEHITVDDNGTPSNTNDDTNISTSVYGISLNDAGDRLLSGGADLGWVALWNVDTGQFLRSLNSNSGRIGTVLAVSLSGDGTVAAAGGADNNVHVWSIATDTNTGAVTATETHRLFGHTADVASVSLNATGTRVLSAGGDGTVRLWNIDTADAASGTEIRALRQHTDYAWSASLSGDGVVALSGGADGKLHLWNTASQPMDTAESFATIEWDWDPVGLGDVRSRQLIGHPSWVGDVSLSADGRLALSGDGIGEVRLWDATTGDHLRTMTDHTAGVLSASLSADGRLVLSGGNDDTARLWNAETGDLLHTLTGHTDSVQGVSLSADGRRALSGSLDGTVRLWDAQTGDPLRTLTPASFFSPFIYNVSLSADGSLALSGNSSTSPDIWNVATGTRLRSLDSHGDSVVTGVSLTADGRFALSGGNDRTVRLWDATTGTLLRTMTGHTDNVWTVSLSPDGRLAMSGGRDETVRLWDTTTGRLLRIMRNHTDDVFGVSLTADGRLALSGGRDETAYLWSLGRSNDTSIPSTADANAGADQSVASASTVTLDGSGSTDSRATSGNPIAYYWRQTAPAGTTLSAANTVTLSANNTEMVTFTAPTVASNTTLEFALTVTDALGLVDTDEVTVTITTSSGKAPPPLAGAAPRGGLITTADAHTATPVGAASRLGSAAYSASDAASPANPTCASAGDGAGHILRGWMHGAHCVYPASLLGTDNPLETDLVFPALPNGGAHIFQGSLIVGGTRDADANSAAASATDGPTLTVEAGTVLAFEGASSSLVVNPGARLHAVGSADRPIILTSSGDVNSNPTPSGGVPQWGGIEINGLGAGGGSGHLEYVVVKHGSANATDSAITLRNVGGDTVVRNLQTYDAAGAGLALVGGTVPIENFVAVYVRGDAIDIGAGWSGTLTNALVIQPERGGNHCLDASGGTNTTPPQTGDAPGTQGHPATVRGLTCITSPRAAADGGQGLGAGIRLGATSAPIIERSLVVGTLADDADPRANYCLRIDNRATRGSPTLTGNVFACEDKTDGALMANGTSVEAYVANGNNQFADVLAPTDPTTATDTELQLLGGTPPVYSLDYDELRVNGTDATVTPPDTTDYPGAASQSTAPNWLRPDGIDWTYGIFEGSRPEPLWFEPAR